MKEIIINGVDVYKQLKRLEQENEALKQSENEVKEIIAELKAENEKLKEENNDLKIYIESNKQQVEEVETLVMDNARLTQEIENLKDIIYYDVEKYKTSLEEIRKYINSQGIDNKWNMRIQRFRIEILNKINEVLK